MPQRHYSVKIAARIEALLADDLVKEDKWASETFLPSILGQYRRNGNITDRQYQFLVKLEEKFTGLGKENLLKAMKDKQLRLEEDAKRWAEEYFGTEVEKQARIVAEYYKVECANNNQEWYKFIWESILAGELPPKRGCMKMINNEYGQKVLTAWNKEPDFPIKSIVQPRKKQKEDPRHPLHGIEFAFVMKVNVAPPVAAAGGKQYLVLPKGDLKGIVCDERHLKAYRRK